MSSRRPTRSAEAWAGRPPAPGAERLRLLEAASATVARDGLTGLGIAAVASEAGVSRPTVYRYFDGRDALVRATLLRAGSDFAERTAAHLARRRDPAEMAVEAVLFALREVPRDPLLRKVWTSTALDASAVADFTHPAALALCRHALKPLVDAAGWREEAAAEAAELLLRLVLSLLAAPGPRRSARDLRGFLARRILPGLGLRSPALETP